MALTKVPSNLDATVATTQSASDNSTNVATTAYVTTAISNLVDSSPDALNTLNELAAALGDDANYASTTNAAIAAKLPLAGGTMTGDLGINQAASGYSNLTVGGTGTIIALRASSGAASLGFYEAGAGRFYLKTRGGGDGLDFVDGDNSSSRLTIDASGNITQSSGTYTIKNASGDSNGLKISQEASDESRIYNHYSGPLTFGTGNTEKMRIHTNDYVGIGTQSPRYDLAVAGTHTTAVGIALDNASGGATCDIAALGTGYNNHQAGAGEIWFFSPDNINIGGATGHTNNIKFLANNKVNMIVKGDGNVGIGTASPQARFDVSVGNAKTANAGVFAYLGKTNESSNYQALQCFQIGGSAADERRYEFQTIEQGVANNGIICFQKSGGRVFVGHDSADGNSDKFSISGGLGISVDQQLGAGSGYGPVNSAASNGTIRLYDSTTGDMNFAANYSAAGFKFSCGGYQRFKIIRSGNGDSCFYADTDYGGWRQGALNSSYHHTMRTSGPSTYYWDNRCEASGGFHTYSDEKLKTDIEVVDGALEKVSKMNGVTFTWKDAKNRGSGDKGKQFGVIAQNMLEVDSELPTLMPDPLAKQEEIDNDELDTDYYTMDYSRLTPFFIEAIKELKEKNEALEARVKELEG